MKEISRVPGVDTPPREFLLVTRARLKIRGGSEHSGRFILLNDWYQSLITQHPCIHTGWTSYTGRPSNCKSGSQLQRRSLETRAHLWNLVLSVLPRFTVLRTTSGWPWKWVAMPLWIRCLEAWKNSAVSRFLPPSAINDRCFTILMETSNLIAEHPLHWRVSNNFTVFSPLFKRRVLETGEQRAKVVNLGWIIFSSKTKFVILKTSRNTRVWVFVVWYCSVT